MTTIRIYQPSKTAMQSGKKKSELWMVEFETRNSLGIDPLMGWVSSSNTCGQLHLSFLTLDEAIQFAKIKGLQYTICNPKRVSRPVKEYGTNFTCSRIRGF